ncbi:MFS transporter [Chloroflexota bacterium]
MAKPDNSYLETTKPKIFYGYVIVATVFFVFLVVTGTLSTFGVFFKPLIETFGWTRVMTSGAFSLYSFLNGSLSIVMGSLTDRFGPRLVLIGAGLLSGIGYMLMSQVSNIWQLYLFYGVLVAVGMSGGIIPALSLIARWFVKRRAMMSGFAMAGMGAGGMTIPLLANWVITAYGWSSSYFILGIITLVLLVAAAQLLKRDPAQMGLSPYGANEVSNKATQGGSHLEIGGLSLRQAMRARQFWLICVLSFSLAFISNSIMVHIVITAIGLGISAANAVFILSIRGGMQVAGQFILGSLADNIGNRPTLTLGFSLMSVTLLWLVFISELWMFYLFAVVLGFSLGCWAAAPALIGEQFGMRSHGLFIGIAFFSSSVGSAIGPVLTGYIFDTTGSYQLAWITTAAVGIMGIIITLLFRQTNNLVQANDNK